MPSILLTLVHAQLDLHNLRLREQITRDTIQANPHTLTFGTPAGDERKLRGIPAIGRNVAGAIPGTSPHGIRWTT
jgi:hypothetical protein